MKVTKLDYYMDGYLKKNLDTAKAVVKKDWDMVFVFDGTEGSGKSVFAMQCAFYFDNTFALDRVVFTPEEFKKAIVNAKPYQAVVYDEAYTGLSSRATMSMINRTLISMLAEIRQKNLLVCVCMPTFFDLDKYVALWRSRALLHIYTGEKFERGFFSFYNTNKKLQLYIKGKKFYSYGLEKPNFRGRFTNFYVLDQAEYREKKKKSLIKREEEQKEIGLDNIGKKYMFKRLQQVDIGLSNRKKFKLIGISEPTFYSWAEKYNKEQIGIENTLLSSPCTVIPTQNT